MGYVQLILAVVAIGIAYRALHLQKNEIKKNGQITALAHLSDLMAVCISFLSKIIDDKKAQGAAYSEWSGLQKAVNQELQPLKLSVDEELLDLMAFDSEKLNEKDIRESLRSKS